MPDGLRPLPAAWVEGESGEANLDLEILQEGAERCAAVPAQVILEK